MFNLTDVINGNHTLSWTQVDNGVELIGGRFSTDATRRRIRNSLTTPASIPEHDLFNGVLWNGDECTYNSSPNSVSDLSFIRNRLAQ